VTVPTTPLYGVAAASQGQLLPSVFRFLEQMMMADLRLYFQPLSRKRPVNPLCL